jgi:hypothetical protein
MLEKRQVIFKFYFSKFLEKFLENQKVCQYSGHIYEIGHPKMSTVSA